MAGTLINGTRVPRQAHPASPGTSCTGPRYGCVTSRDHLGSAMATQVNRSPSQPNVAFDAPRSSGGGVISNVGGNQYNEYVQQIIVNRQEAFRQIAPMSRIARGLFIVGFSLAVSGVLGFIGSIMVMIACASTRT